jgi:PEP-CTERM motif
MTLSRSLVLLVLSIILLALPALAGTFPYLEIGTPLATGFDIYATGGSVKAYFHSSDAWFFSALYLDSPAVLGPALPNHTSTAGRVFDFGSYAAGTPLRFRLLVDRRDGSFRSLYSGSAPAPDGETEIHTFLAAWSGGTIPGSSVAIHRNALFVGWEDVHGQTSDWDYNDHQFVLTNASTSHTPEPGTLVLMGSAAIMLGLLRRRQRG